jgi:RAB6A-GEF complex partner protein 1
VRELSIMSPKSPPVSMRFIPEQNDEGVLKHDTNGSSNLLSQQPSRYFPHICYSNLVHVDFYSPFYAIRCLMLRMNGELSVLYLDDGHEHALTNSVELFWVTCSQFEEKGSLLKEVSWLDYGHQGMQVRSIILWCIYAQPWAPLLNVLGSPLLPRHAKLIVGMVPVTWSRSF